MNYELQKQERLVGIVDFKMEQLRVAPYTIELWALYKYETKEFKHLGGGAVSMPEITFREEWRQIGGAKKEYVIT